MSPNYGIPSENWGGGDESGVATYVGDDVDGGGDDDDDDEMSLVKTVMEMVRMHHLRTLMA